LFGSARNILQVALRGGIAQVAEDRGAVQQQRQVVGLL